MTKSRGILSPRRLWSDDDLELLRANYADTRTEDLAVTLNRTLSTVYQKARRLGLVKSDEYLASPAACRLRRGDNVGAAHRFKPGQASWSKGLKGVVGVQEACRATQFKKGRPANEARNYRPIGDHRISADGVLERKITDDPSIVPARRWVAVHRLVWAEAFGPIPADHAVVFRRGMKTVVLEEITVDRLECITRQELLQRNRLPPELQRVTQLRGALTRAINRRKKQEEQASEQ